MISRNYLLLIMAQPSNPQHTYPARKPGHLLRRALIRLLCVLLALQPMLAQAAPALAQPTTLEALEGKVSLLAKTDADYVQKRRREEDLLWWNERDQGRHEETVRPVEIEAGGGLRINAGRGVDSTFRAWGVWLNNNVIKRSYQRHIAQLSPRTGPSGLAFEPAPVDSTPP